jgi:hypothetical protein
MSHLRRSVDLLLSLRYSVEAGPVPAISEPFVEAVTFSRLRPKSVSTLGGASDIVGRTLRIFGIVRAPALPHGRIVGATTMTRCLCIVVVRQLTQSY